MLITRNERLQGLRTHSVVVYMLSWVLTLPKSTFGYLVVIANGDLVVVQLLNSDFSGCSSVTIEVS